jgi:hypothetical protein
VANDTEAFHHGVVPVIVLCCWLLVMARHREAGGMKVWGVAA